MTTQTPLLASLHPHRADTGTVRVEDVFDTDLADLWNAITDPARLARWLVTVTGDLRLGGEFHATFTSSWDGPGRIEVCEQGQRLLVTMTPGTDDETVIEAVLTAEGDKTRLVIEERGIPLRAIAGHGAGWQAHLEDLATHLANGECGTWSLRWTELTPAYEELVRQLR
ncbi:hypothetical protein GCM10022234_23440 [Aeromicrobium panaciterrae]|uniref:SRPBCC domain-containing protein n=1 Tax=Aeromicrobium panaciterrae TaxID=363861 RepID=UPI0031CE1646